MKYPVFVVLLTAVLSAGNLFISFAAQAEAVSRSGVTTGSEEIKEVTLTLPPVSLAQWYKPVNKRQVWLHTMFRVRQSLQAVEIYLAKGDRQRLLKWATTLQGSYAKLSKMVPEWEDKIRLGVADELLAHAQTGDIAKVTKSVKRLQRFCDACHQEWKATVTAIYRSPDYSRVMVATVDGAGNGADLLAYPEAMQQLSGTLGQLKVAREDDELEVARAATVELTSQLQQLGGSCDGCHRDPESKERILGEATFASLAALETSLGAPHDLRESGRHLGNIGYTVCGRCHSIHRALGDLRGVIVDEPN